LLLLLVSPHAPMLACQRTPTALLLPVLPLLLLQVCQPS
jgi:hypothetical protein